MILLQCVNLTKSFGVEPILTNIKFEIQSKQRIALVGRNGAGKSTLLRIIAGQMSYDSGDIMIPKDVKLGYLAQDTGLESNLSIWDEMLSVFAELQRKERTLRRLEEQMSNPENDDYEKILKEYDQLQVNFKDEGGYQYEADIRSVLAGLNFANFDYDTKISTLSGGQKTRLALGKLLLTKPDLLILDEPTNHLDIATLSWLEQYLSNYPGAVLIVSHDRYFLDKVVDHVYELSRTKATKFKGNYSDYLEENALRYDQELKQFEKQQEEIAKLEDFVRRNIARASTTKRAQSRRRTLERMERLDRPQGSEKSANFTFDIEKQTGNEVLKVQALSGGYDNVALFKEITFQLNRGESVALIGPNGIGKSTMLKMITKELQPLSGSITYGSNVAIGYYDQEQAKLTSNKQVIHELWDEYPLVQEKDIRTVLGNFLFSGDDVLKIVSDLSGGEKARLALAKLMLKKANFLILDEPTNHLDLDSKEVLESALIDYPGTILFVSHDRYFLNRMATRIIELSQQNITNYLGDYDYYLHKKDEARQLHELANEEQAHKEEPKKDKQNFHMDKEAKRKERQRLRRIEEIEATVDQMETEVAEWEQALCEPSVYEDHEKSAQLQQQIDSHNETIEQLLTEWEELQE
ncbi:ABC-F family ATP-binding cassette domain-containing protein [Alkalihalobacterium chitinilyticum]|uniref:ABC-F family ATP-binding cassette domain-containing protein n=1 Tax=Alkalihalobacterium chitinilyticum TaxID=2980103 RepID=A0ABT5VLL5_9BACI|nr:ABC-F family ATP-binding cassette domain-containing protein [Alkalihalobacterium chitinilyticum]MDE5416192.1 ABC-F family ATP-binding cassette domain-containing protein [Alkalihalobacterium chitinilyticum]